MHPRLALALALLAVAPLAGRAADLNVITSVEVKDEGATVALSVKGTKKPSFTTFAMSDPPRFVIDFSESRFQGVAEDMQIQDGTINVVKNLSYGSDATSIARVMIAFAVEVVPPAVEDQGETLVVRIAKPAEAAAVAQSAKSQQDQAARAKADADAQAQRARAEAEAQARSDAERKATEAADARAKAEADEKIREAAEAQARADAEAKARAEADARARQDEEERLLAEARARDSKAKVDAEAHGAAPAAAPAGDAQARAEAEAKAQAETQARAEQEAQARAVEEKAGQDAARKAQQDLERQRSEAEAQAKAAAPEPAPADEPAPTPEPAKVAAAPVAAPAARLDGPAPKAKLREVGFKQLPGVSRVFVRTSPMPRFTIQDLGENTIRVELENTRPGRRNDLRFLDTSFFSSAIALVTPSRRGSSYLLDIKLKQRVPYQQKIEGDVLALDFERPAATASATPAAAAASPAAAPADPAAEPAAEPAADEPGPAPAR